MRAVPMIWGGFLFAINAQILKARFTSKNLQLFRPIFNFEPINIEHRANV